MSDFYKVDDRTIINLDNIKTITTVSATKNGGTPMLLVTYMDCTGSPIPFENVEKMNETFYGILNNNK